MLYCYTTVTTVTEKFTGFSPIHAVVALGLHEMLHFLLDLPPVEGMPPWPGADSTRCEQHDE